MAHVFKMSDWESPTGWHCGDVENLAGGSGNCWIPCRILDISPADFILMLVEEYNAHISYDKEKCFLNYWWDKQEDERKFKNFINARARKINAII